MLNKHLISLIAFVSSFALTPTLQAQDGRLATVGASPADGPAWYSVNPEAWDSFVSFNGDRMFGKANQHVFVATVNFDTTQVRWGKKIATQTFQPEIKILGPMFGGEGYSHIVGALPVDQQYADALYLLGGWKYHLTPVVDIDIGGSAVFYDKAIYGPGIPALLGGSKTAGSIYLGFIGRTLLEPSVYIIYEPVFDQYTVQTGIFHAFDLAGLSGVQGLGFEVGSTLGWLNANRWNGKNQVNGGNWRNSYVYWENKGDLVYRPNAGLTLRAGIGWALNNDGNGNNGIVGTSLGPDNNLWFRTGIEFRF
jgi:hypothetical protein